MFQMDREATPGQESQGRPAHLLPQYRQLDRQLDKLPTPLASAIMPEN
jgi:hypothetical protein